MMQTLDLLASVVAQHGDEIALEDDQSEVSYAELNVAVNALAVALQSKDATPGSRVGLCAENSLEYLVSVLAILAAGKVLLPLNCRGTTESLHQLLNETLPTTVIVDDAGDALIKSDDDLKIHFSQFEGLVRTYRDQVPVRYTPEEVKAYNDKLQAYVEKLQEVSGGN
ncbi:long-chain fatty acid--CoA ligase [Parapusillimonas sp. SGNA-6]|jgi:acyl-CoA synthetase (AMP-forming)/AMP-acid ligase II|nr:long-chain fatty acid--CoA ligase [Parapusillimonas sp. SGNA-6]